MEFLRKDCNNVNDYFRRQGVGVMTTRELFQLIVDPTIDSEAKAEDYLTEADARSAERSAEERTTDDAVFMQAYIPHKLDDVAHFERDVRIARPGGTPANPFHTIVTGMRADLTGPQQSLSDESGDSDDDDDGDSEPDGSVSKDGHEAKSGDGEEDGAKVQVDRHNVRDRDESPNTRKLRKQAVKEMQRENRTNKTPKHMKKRKKQLAAGKHK
uniref:Uncharacterized protein n=1 Tax=Plectus sambesii TaxID=2011161 RepID=A0A914UVC3_9BILA